MPTNLGTLYVQCQRGRGLYNVEVLGRKMDPYAKLQFQGKEHKTKTDDNGHKAPEWSGGPTFDFPVSDADNGSPKRILVVEVYEENKVRDDSMIGCNYSFDVAPYLSAASDEQHPAFHSWVNLQTVGGKSGGEVMLKIWFKPNPANSSGRLAAANEGISLASLSKTAGGPAPAVWVPPSLQQQQQQQQHQQPAPKQQSPAPQQQQFAVDPNRRPSNPQLFQQPQQQAPPSPLPLRTSSSGQQTQSSPHQRPVLPGGYPEAPPPLPAIPQQHSGPRPLPANPTGIYPPQQQPQQGPPYPMQQQYAPQQAPYPPQQQPQQHMQHSGGSGVYPPPSPYGAPSNGMYPPAPPAQPGYPPNVYPPAQPQQIQHSGGGYPANDLYPPPQPQVGAYPPNHLYPPPPGASPALAYPAAQPQHQGVYPPPNHLYPPNGPQQPQQPQQVYPQHSGGGVYQIQSGGRPAPGLPPR